MLNKGIQIPQVKATIQGLEGDRYPQRRAAENIIIIEMPASSQCGPVSIFAIINPKTIETTKEIIHLVFILRKVLM
jgi:hypothetical protein